MHALHMRLHVAALSGLIMAGCSLTRDPSVVVSAVTQTAMTDEALVLDFAVDLKNPNPDDTLRLDEFSYDLAVNGVKVYSGMRAAEASLASNDARQLHIPAVVRFDAMGWTRQTAPAAARYHITGRLRYIEPGEIAKVFRDMGFPNPSVSFADKGEVPLQ